MRPAITSIINFLSSQFGTLIGFIATFYIASELGPEVLGTYSVAVGILFWVYLPASAIDSAVEKRVSEGNNRGQIVSAAIIMNTPIVLLTVIGVMLFSSSVEAYVGEPIIGEIVILLISGFTAKFMSSVLHGQNKVAQSSLTWTASRVVRTGSQIGLTFVLGLGVSGLMWGHSISYVVAAGLAISVNSVRPACPNRKEFRNLLEYAKYSWLGQLSSQAFNWLDTVILALFVSSTKIGIYEVAWTMASALAVVSSSISTTLFPIFSELDSNKSHDKISGLLEEGLIFAGILMIPGIAGALAVGPRVLEIYGSEYGEGGLILVLLVIARLTNGYSGLFKNTINSIDRPDIGFRINAIIVCLNVILNFSLIPLFSWHGAAMGTAGSAAIGLLFGYYWVNQSIPIRVPYQEIGFQFVASLIMILAASSLSQMLGPGRIETIVIVLISAGVYSGALLILSNTVRQKTISILSSHPYLRAILVSGQ